MKIRNKYTMVVNGFTQVVFWGNFNTKGFLGEIYDCSLHELKHNLNILSKQKFLIVRK